MENNKKTNLFEEEYNTTYAALALIKALYEQGKVEKHVYKNILLECANKIDTSDFNIAA